MIRQKTDKQSKYVPPNRRANKQKQSNAQARSINTDNVSEFPALGSEEVTHNVNCKNVNALDLDYAGATREEEQPSKKNENMVPRGWVKAKMCHNTTMKGNSIQKEYGEGTEKVFKQTTQYEQSDPDHDPLNCGLTASQSKELTKLVRRWQTDRDFMNDYLDQSSPHWGAKHIDDPLSEDDLESDVDSCQSEDEDNDMLDYDDY